jgi:hypothetical protein
MPQWCTCMSVRCWSCELAIPAAADRGREMGQETLELDATSCISCISVPHPVGSLLPNAAQI